MALERSLYVTKLVSNGRRIHPPAQAAVVGFKERMMPTVDEIFDALREVSDPELGINIVDLGLVYGVTVNPEGSVDISFTVTYPGCPAAGDIFRDIGVVVQRLDGVSEARPHLVWDPPWGPALMSEAARLELGYPI